MNIFDTIRKAVRNLFHHTKLEAALGIEIAVSTKMEESIDLWTKMFLDEPPWKDEKAGQETLGLPNSIASEIARLTTVEMVSTVVGSPRADYINEQYQKVIAKARNYTEYAAGMGGIAMKPYLSGKKIPVSIVYAEDFYPTVFDSDGDIRGACFMDYAYDNKHRYTRVEEHGFEADGTYYIRNKCFRQRVSDIAIGDEKLGEEVPLAEVPEWAEVTEYIPIGNLKKPLFAYFRMPFANNVEPKSPLGVAAYSRAVNLIREADRLWSEVLWEYDGGELAVNASTNLFQKDITGKAIIPEGRERMFKETFDFDDQNFLETFNPPFRDSSLFNGLNKTEQRIEFQCGLAYGTISDPNMVDKTATEINAAKQRSYSTIHDTQAALEKALRDLVYAIDSLCTLYNLAPEGSYDVTFQWDDSIIVDAEQERLRDRDEVRDGLMQKWEYRVKWYGETPEKAKQMVSEGSNSGLTDDQILGLLNEPEADEGKEGNRLKKEG